MPEISDEQRRELHARYGSETSGPNWAAEDYADGPFKDRMLNRAKEDARVLLADNTALRRRVDSLSEQLQMTGQAEDELRGLLRQTMTGDIQSYGELSDEVATLRAALEKQDKEGTDNGPHQ